MAKIEVFHPKQKYTISDKRPTFVIGRKLDITYFVTKTKPLGTPIMIFSAFPYIWGSQQGSEWGQVGQKWKKMDEINIYIYGLSYGSHLKTNYSEIMYHQSDGTDDVTKHSRVNLKHFPSQKG